MNNKVWFFLNRSSLQSKLWFIVGLQIFALAFSVIFSSNDLNTISQRIMDVHQESFNASNLILNADRDLYQAIFFFQVQSDVNSKDYLENVAQTTERVAEARKIMEEDKERWAKYKLEGSNEDIFKVFDDFNQALNTWLETNKLTNKLDETSQAQFDAAREHLNKLGELIQINADAEFKVLEAQKNKDVWMMIISNFVAVVLILICVVLVLKVITTSLKKLTAASQQLATGNVDITVESWSKDDIGKLSDSFNVMIENIREQSQVIEKIAEGDLNVELKVRSEKDILVKSLIRVVAALQELIAETGMLTEAATRGQLSSRGNAEKFHGGYKDIVNGINLTLDAITVPLNEADFVLGKMAVNDYTSEITGKYQGQLQQLTDAINMVRTRLLSVQDIAVRVSRGDTSRLEEFRRIGKRSENDQTMPAFTRMMEVIQEIVNESKKLSDAAIEGDLQIRGNAEKFEGGYRMIIEGFNNTLDAVVEPVNEAVDVAKELAKGNLRVNMAGDYRGDHAALKNALNTAIEAFNNVLGEIDTAAEQVAAGSRQVSDSSQALSQGSSEQASTVEEITASVTQIAAQTRQNAANAKQANELAVSVREKATEGNSQMQEMLDAMKEINESSANIAKIIKVIDDIAFQTNILALNAAVEAARAGQHGKGFAVVADEVRNLAARSANAAKETTGMIEGSIKKVENGTRLANETAAALNHIVEGVSKTSDLVGEIAVASNEQATGITQINLGISQVSQVTQGNTATAEESAAASEELSSQAMLLKASVERFELQSAQKALTDHMPRTVSKEKSRSGGSAKNRIMLDDGDFSKY